jgi:hypothetical protein
MAPLDWAQLGLGPIGIGPDWDWARLGLGPIGLGPIIGAIIW